jgi:phosphate transport system protein
MSRLIDEGLEQLTTTLTKMGELAEDVIALSIEGFLEGVDVCEKVHSLSEVLITMSEEIEGRSFELIAKYQPVASDLRMIKSYMKIAYDLERYGRYAWDISFIHKRLHKSKRCVPPEFLILVENMTETVMEMVNTSIKSLKNHDADLAETLAETEERVDESYFKYLDLILGASDAEKGMITTLLVVRYLERIADHATYMGESIIYIATGERKFLR